MVLAKGTPVQSSDGVELGTVVEVLQVPEKDVFDGIVIQTPNGRRFADAAEVAYLYENLMLLSIDGEEAAQLPKPGQTPGHDEALARRRRAGTVSGERAARWRRISRR